MTISSFPSWSDTAASNVDVGGIGLNNSATPTQLDDIPREMMAQLHRTLGAAFYGSIWGLTLSNGTDATNDIDIAAGAAIDSTNARAMILGSSITKRLDASWAVGTGNGGLDTGSIGNGTYHMWLIMRSDTGVVDALFSASASAPTMPSNYDYKRRIGSVLRESAALVSFTQVGDKFMRNTPAADVSAADPGTSAVTRTLSVPLGIKAEAVLGAGIFDLAAGSSAIYVYLSDLSQTDVAASSSNAQLASQGSSANSLAVVGNIRVVTNTSGQIRSRLSASAANQTLVINTHGWIDTRGRIG